MLSPAMRTALLVMVAALLLPRTADAQERYALGMFHFNVQYVAGGLVEFPGYLDEDLSPVEVEDRIVVESLAPVLELYSRHPGWGVDIEMQAYLLDVLAERHPAVLEMLRSLAKSGQIDVLSFHYSDQLFIAYPEEDWERSQALAQRTFERHDVPLAKSVFCQEGQSGMGMADRMAERGYEVMIWPKNLWIEQHGDFDAHPVYRFGDVSLVAGAKDVSYASGGVDIEVRWTFFDDGELLATNDNNPYFPDLFVHDPAAVAAYEQRVVDLEAQGFAITTVREYVEAVKDRVPVVDPPPLFDGTWQPGSTSAVAKWMGVRSLWNLGAEPADRDNHVRTLGSMAHRELVAAEAAATAAGLDERDRLDDAWRLLFLGQVTDATGINPYRGEVEYGIAHLTEVLRIARDVIEGSKSAADLPDARIDPLSGAVAAGSEQPFVGEPSDPLLEVVAEVEDPTRTVDTTWERVAPELHRVSVRFGAGDVDSRSWPVSVTFPGTLEDELVTTLALADDAPHTFRRSGFAFQGDSFHIALPLGLISLGSGLHLIKDTAHVHLAAEVRLDSGDVTFRDETLQLDEAVTWVFYLFEGSADDAASLARQINSARVLIR